MPPNTAITTRSATAALPQETLPTLTREEQHAILGTFAIPSDIDQEGLDLARRWGVRPGSTEWIDLMTGHEIARNSRQNSDGLLTPESIRTTPDGDSAQPPGTPDNPIAVESLASTAAMMLCPSQKENKTETVGTRAACDEDSTNSFLSSAPTSDGFALDSEHSHQEHSAAKIKTTVTPSRKRKAAAAEPEEANATTTTTITTIRRSKRLSSITTTTRSSPVPVSTAPAAAAAAAASGLPTSKYNTRRRSQSKTITTSPTLTPIITTTTTTPAPQEPSTATVPTTTPTEPRPYKCTHPTCKYHTQGFRRVEHMRRHVASIHDQIIVASCDRCGVGFTRKDTLKVHVRMCRLVRGGIKDEEVEGAEGAGQRMVKGWIA